MSINEEIIGTVKSYSTTKKFGFISGSNGDSFFFHITDVDTTERAAITIGSLVVFEEMPKPKGMAAVKIKLRSGVMLLLSDPKSLECFVSKNDNFGSDKQVVYTGPLISVESRDPDYAINRLKSKAQNIGCNALSNFTRTKRTGRKGNYKFSIHVIQGKPTLLKVIEQSVDIAKVEENEAAIKAEIEKINKIEITNEEYSNGIIYGCAHLIGIASTIFLILFFFGAFR